ncbi:unnamed protein product, partial [Candidula unifasciata]
VKARKNQDKISFKKSDGATRGKRSFENKVCVLNLVGDFTLYMGVCKGSFASCVALMFASVNFMDNIYTTSKFVDSHRTYLGIGFRVGEISLYRAYSEQPSDFNYTNLTHFNYNTKWTASDRLASFGMYLSILTYKKRFCAHHLFTNYPHPGQILGIAYTRTLCYPGIDKPGFPKINVAISSATDNKAGPITTLQMNLVFAH